MLSIKTKTSTKKIDENSVQLIQNRIGRSPKIFLCKKMVF